MALRYFIVKNRKAINTKQADIIGISTNLTA